METHNQVPNFNWKTQISEIEDDFEPMPLDIFYILELTAIEPIQSKFNDKEGMPKVDLLWKFTVIKPDKYNKRVLNYWTSCKCSRTIKANKPNKTLSLLHALRPNDKYEIGMAIDYGSYVYANCKATLKEKIMPDGKTWQSIAQIMPLNEEERRIYQPAVQTPQNLQPVNAGAKPIPERQTEINEQIKPMQETDEYGNPKNKEITTIEDVPF